MPYEEVDAAYCVDCDAPLDAQFFHTANHRTEPLYRKVPDTCDQPAPFLVGGDLLGCDRIPDQFHTGAYAVHGATYKDKYGTEHVVSWSVKR